MSDFEESDVEPEKEQEEELSDKEELLKTKVKPTSVQKKIKSEDDDLESDDNSLISSDDDLESEVDSDQDELEGELQELDALEDSSKEKSFNYEDSMSLKPLISPVNSDVESDDEEEYQKFDNEVNNNYVNINHPESYTYNAVEIEALCVIKRNANGDIDDEKHRTVPILSKYEKTRILGQRAKQINNGSKPLIVVPKDILDGYLIAQLELEKKLIPVIIQRPLPNGVSEYWKLNDLEII